MLEFPPVMSAKSLFILRYDGTVQCIYKDTGKVRWSRHVGSLAASSPMLDVKNERLYVTLLEHVQFVMKDGKVFKSSDAAVPMTN